MPLTNSETTSRSPLNLEQRKALVWIRENEPCMPPTDRVSSRLRVWLLQGGLIQLDPKRRRFDSITYVLTDAGREALG